MGEQTIHREAEQPLHRELALIELSPVSIHRDTDLTLGQRGHQAANIRMRIVDTRR